jgi:hypothetical protein
MAEVTPEKVFTPRKPPQREMFTGATSRISTETLAFKTHSEAHSESLVAR